jgi:hypothetical protein
MKENMNVINSEANDMLYVQIKKNPMKVVLKTQNLTVFNKLKNSYEHKCLLQGRQKDGAFNDENLFSTYVLQLAGEHVLVSVLDLLKSDNYKFCSNDYVKMAQFAHYSVKNKEVALEFVNNSL